MINLRNALMVDGKRTPTAKDYVQDGLVAMWDGIENAGWGQHNSAPTGWADLIAGNNVASISGKMEYKGNGYLGLNASGLWDVGSSLSNVSSIESCLKIQIGEDSTKGQNIITPQGYGNKLPLVIKPIDGEFYVPLQYYSQPTKVIKINALIDKTVTLSIKVGQGWVNGIDSTSTMRFSTYDGWMYSYVQQGYMAWGSRNSAPLNNGTACLVHCIRLYSRALTADEVAANHAVDKARFNLPNAT